MIFKPYSIVVVPFPFTDSAKTKRRPALILSHESFQRENGHVALAMITSARHSAWHGDVEIKKLEAAGLPSKSIIRQKLFTIDVRLIEKQVGALDPSDRKAFQKVFAEHLTKLK